MPEPTRYQQISAAAARLLATEGESGRFEFKRSSEAVKPDVLVAAANWVALDPERDSVTLLVGVDEVQDPATGLVTGHVRGLTGQLSTHVDRIQQYVRNTDPVPVDVRIIEEAVSTAKPFLRLEIKPTFAPHYDGAGRRVTRQGASTRPLTDEELLNLYLDREGEQFEQRFRRSADLLIGFIDSVSEDVSELANRLEGGVEERLNAVLQSSWSAARDAEDSKSLAEDILEGLHINEEILPRIDSSIALSAESLFFRLEERRQSVWFQFCTDTMRRESAAADALAAALKAALEEPIHPEQWLINLTEYRFWSRKLSERERHAGGAPMTMKWWREAVTDRQRLSVDDARLRLEARSQFMKQLREDILAASSPRRSRRRRR